MNTENIKIIIATQAVLLQSAQCAVISIGGNLPNSTISTPTLNQSATGVQEISTDRAGISHISVSNFDLDDVYSSTIQIYLHPQDIGDNGGVLNISGYYGLSASIGRPNTANDANGRLAYTTTNGAFGDIVNYDGTQSLNNSSPTLTLSINSGYIYFSIDLPIHHGSEMIDITNYADSSFVGNGAWILGGDTSLQNPITLSYTQNQAVPEHSSTMLFTAAILLLINRRHKQE